MNRLVSPYGLGRKFQIWVPGRCRAEFAAAAARLRALTHAEPPLGEPG
jgi:hypothetical protein